MASCAISTSRWTMLTARCSLLIPQKGTLRPNTGLVGNLRMLIGFRVASNKTAVTARNLRKNRFRSNRIGGIEAASVASRIWGAPLSTRLSIASCWERHLGL